MDGEFAGRVVFITGAARGLGQAAARIFASRGARLFLVDIRHDLLEATRAELAAAGADCRVLATDIGHRANCFQAIEAAMAAFGRLDVLCNVAAIVRFHHTTEAPAADWERILAVNLSAPFFLSQAAIPHLLQTSGNIVNVTSQAGTIGAAYLAAYAASKGGLVQMTKAMAMEYLREPIRINAVSPGTMRTGIGEGVERPDTLDADLMRRYGGIRPRSEPEDVAEMIAFVASDRARGVHGAVLHADSGVTTG